MMSRRSSSMRSPRSSRSGKPAVASSLIDLTKASKRILGTGSAPQKGLLRARSLRSCRLQCCWCRMTSPGFDVRETQLGGPLRGGKACCTKRRNWLDVRPHGVLHIEPSARVDKDGEAPEASKTLRSRVTRVGFDVRPDVRRRNPLFATRQAAPQASGLLIVALMRSRVSERTFRLT